LSTASFRFLDRFQEPFRFDLDEVEQPWNEPHSVRAEARLRAHLQGHDSKNELLFVNRRGRPYSANKLREKKLHPLLKKLGIPRGGFHAARHGATSALFADGVSPVVVQKQLRHSDARITLEIYGHVIGDEQRIVVQNRSARLVN
jgi:integrase